jgi:hypothetical protein
MLQAVGGGRVLGAEGEPRDLVVPDLADVRVGVRMSNAVHLLTAFTQRGRTVVAQSDRLAKVAGVEPPPARGRAVGRHRFERPGATRRLLDKLGPESWERVGVVTDAPLADALVEGVARMLDVGELTAGAVAQRLGGPAGAQHALRFALLDRDSRLVGGYTVVVG